MKDKNLAQLEEERLDKIKQLNEEYKKKKQKLMVKIPELTSYAFDVVTDVKLTREGYPRYAKRKAIFLTHLERYFDVTPKEEIEDSEPLGIEEALEGEDDLEVSLEDNNQSPETVKSERLGGNKDIHDKPKEVRDNICSSEHRDTNSVLNKSGEKS